MTSLKRARDFRKTLDEQSIDGRANYIFLGDLNTMGLDYPYAAHDISAEKEISELKRRVKYRDMQLLGKNAPQTFRKPTPSELISDLDHVVAAEHLQFRQFNGASIDVRGWPTLATESERDQWNQNFSDHALLYFEVLAS